VEANIFLLYAFFNSAPPFDMTINGDMLTANILAESYDKAEQVLHDYVRGKDVL
jgi:hypothetical protein